jgi:WD40 repeat protein
MPRAKFYSPVLTTTLSLPKEVYVTNLYLQQPTGGDPASILAVSTDDSLHVLSPESLKPNTSIQNLQQGFTELRTVPGTDQIFSAGRDGVARLWDLRTGKKVHEFTAPEKRPLLSLEHSAGTSILITGSELEDHKAIITLFDTRAVKKEPLRTYADPHNDDITQLSLHPSHSNYLLSGSTDGLINLIDTNIQESSEDIEENEAVIATANHGASIFRAGWIGDKDVYALSHDDKLAVHDMDPDAAREDEDGIKNESERTTEFGDIKEVRGVSYGVDILGYSSASGQEALVAAGRRESGPGSLPGPRLDLFELKLDEMSKQEAGYKLDRFPSYHLISAHGEELVRSMVRDPTSSLFWTSGEDGTVKIWKHDTNIRHKGHENDEAFNEESKDRHGIGKVKKNKHKKDDKSRNKPY